MPKPMHGESRDHFMSRCVRQLISDENKPRDQAVAICSSYWEDKKKDKKQK